MLLLMLLFVFRWWDLFYEWLVILLPGKYFYTALYFFNETS